MPPSEYWSGQCFVGSSSVSRAETDMRYEIGVDCMMFGSDYPHVEGTWPRTFDWVAATLGGIPEASSARSSAATRRVSTASTSTSSSPSRSASASRSPTSPSAATSRARAHPGRPPRDDDEPQLRLTPSPAVVPLAAPVAILAIARRSGAPSLGCRFTHWGMTVDDSKLGAVGRLGGIVFVVLVLITAFAPRQPAEAD